jgi:hypothetical protein
MFASVPARSDFHHRQRPWLAQAAVAPSLVHRSVREASRGGAARAVERGGLEMRSALSPKILLHPESFCFLPSSARSLWFKVPVLKFDYTRPALYRLVSRRAPFQELSGRCVPISYRFISSCSGAFGSKVGSVGIIPAHE